MGLYHGLLVGPLREAPLLLDRLLGGALLPSELLDGHRLNMLIPERSWQEPACGLGQMCGKVAIGGFIAGHSGGGPGSVIAVYRLYDRQPIRTGAAFLAMMPALSSAPPSCVPPAKCVLKVPAPCLREAKGRPGPQWPRRVGRRRSSWPR